MAFPSMQDCIITEHAQFEMQRRGLSERIVRAVLGAPDQKIEVRPGRVVLQSKLPVGQPGRTYLVRVFVDVARQPAEVVTTYKTSKIAKYWREES